jgi:hypothetical protein
MVVENGVGLLQEAAAFGGDQFGVAGARADQIDLSGGHE